MKTEQENRIYALNLMNRLFEGSAAYNSRDIAVLARIIPLLEDDMADWLGAQLKGVVSRERIATCVREGDWRPDLPQPVITTGSNLR